MPTLHETAVPCVALLTNDRLGQLLEALGEVGLLPRQLLGRRASLGIRVGAGTLPLLLTSGAGGEQRGGTGPRSLKSRGTRGVRVDPAAVRGRVRRG